MEPKARGRVGALLWRVGRGNPDRPHEETLLNVGRCPKEKQGEVMNGLLESVQMGLVNYLSGERLDATISQLRPRCKNLGTFFLATCSPHKSVPVVGICCFCLPLPSYPSLWPERHWLHPSPREVLGDHINE